MDELIKSDLIKSLFFDLSKGTSQQYVQLLWV